MSYDKVDIDEYQRIIAENERLRFEADEYQRRHRIVRRRAEQAEARTRALEAALEAVIHAFHPKFYQGCTAPPCDRVRAALTEPPPPQEAPR